MLRNNSSGFGEFFRYHGWLAPGVRLFRRIGFRSKALCIGLAFLLPLLMLLGFAGSSARSKIESSRSEMAGVAYMKPLLGLARAAQLRRAAALAGQTEQGPVHDAVKAAFQAVAAQQQAQGMAFGTGEAFNAMRQAHEALLAAAQAATPDETFARHSAFIDRVLDLARGVSDGSQLVLDPELDTFHLMTMAVLRGPMQVENTARLRDMGALVLRTASLSRERRDRIVQWSSVWDHLERDVENAYRRGIVAVPGLAARFDMVATDAAAAALRKAVAGQVLAEQARGDAQAYLATGDAAVDKQHALVLAVLDRLDQRLQERVDSMVGTLSLQFGLSALGLALAGYLLLAFYKVMMGGLQEVSGHLQAISRGNLGTVPEPWGRDEAAQVMLTLRAMQQSLRSVVATVLEGSARVKSTSLDISSATHNLSQRAEQSAASLQQTATSTEQIAATARHTADAVDSAMAIVRDNALAAARGGQVIARVVETMTGIRTASNRIGEIIAVIDGIAFQTNILALNAAVEAARAGEQGRGFAVVAAEVRSLARRSADAAKEIKTLITASIGQVETGNTIVAEAGATIADIVAKAKSIDTMMAQVSSATHEQTAGVGQVGNAVRDIDRATQQNAALVEQTAVATSALSDEAGRLQEAVSFFTVEKPQRRG